MKKLIPQKLKNIYHLANAVLANLWYGFPTKKLKVIGVTGTNGKTTTVQMISKILEQAGHIVAASSTINFKIGDEEWVNKTKFTTLSSWQVQSFSKQALEAGCDYLILEISSHSLDQNRAWGVDFDVAVVTNVTREHLDYHKNMQEYRRAKVKLFKMLAGDGVAVVNLDMDRPEEFLSMIDQGQNEQTIYGYAARKEILNSKSEILNKFENRKSKFEIRAAENIQSNSEGSKFEIENTTFHINLPGRFNIENALAAICVGLSQNVDLKIMAGALDGIKGIPGRMDYVENNRGIKIIIDYAVTPDSMEKLGEAISGLRFSNYKSGNNANSPDTRHPTLDNRKLIWVFGSCGERDRGKRPIMGKIVSKFADYAIVTNEDPYHESPQGIIDEVFKGVLEGGKKENIDAWKIFDRKEAIKKALGLAHDGDTVLITGKGAEETMAVGDERIHWNDRKVVEELLDQTQS